MLRRRPRSARGWFRPPLPVWGEDWGEGLWLPLGPTAGAEPSSRLTKQLPRTPRCSDQWVRLARLDAAFPCRINSEGGWRVIHIASGEQNDRQRS